VDEEAAAHLRSFGPPIYVPATPGWRVAGVDLTNGEASGALVLSAQGVFSVSTESDLSPSQPISVRVESIQAATVNGAQRAEWRRVMVDDEDGELTVDGTLYPVQVLKSRCVFGLQVRVGDRTVRGKPVLTIPATPPQEQA
jgi:hypothetical protein